MGHSAEDGMASEERGCRCARTEGGFGGSAGCEWRIILRDEARSHDIESPRAKIRKELVACPLADVIGLGASHRAWTAQPVAIGCGNEHPTGGGDGFAQEVHQAVGIDEMLNDVCADDKVEGSAFRACAKDRRSLCVHVQIGFDQFGSDADVARRGQGLGRVDACESCGGWSEVVHEFPGGSAPDIKHAGESEPVDKPRSPAIDVVLEPLAVVYANGIPVVRQSVGWHGQVWSISSGQEVGSVVELAVWFGGRGHACGVVSAVPHERMGYLVARECDDRRMRL